MKQLQVYNARRDAHIKNTSVRNSVAAGEATKQIEKMKEVMNVVFQGKETNYYIAKCFSREGDIYMEKKEYGEAERLFHKAQIIIGEKFGEVHPIIMGFNQSLIEAYSQQENEEKRHRCMLISEKNMEIAKKNYGALSVFLLKWILSLASNRIAASQYEKAQMDVAQSKMIV